MVMKIPEHLAHLATDARGRPIPYVNIRGEADVVERWTIRYDPAVRGVAAFYEDDPEGEVDFTHASIQRARSCMVYGRCQVCTRPVDWGYRYLAFSPGMAEAVDVGGAKWPVISEPWLCPDDFEFAGRYCPGLIRRRTTDGLEFVRVDSPEDIQLIKSEGWIEGPYEESTKANPVVMWAKVILFTRELAS